eukprot:gene24288-8211_t
MSQFDAGHVVPWELRAWGIPTIVVPLSVAGDAGTKQRLIFDCRCCNYAELQSHFSLPSVLDLGHALPQGETALWKFDQKSGYHVVRMHPSMLGLIAICWDGR